MTGNPQDGAQQALDSSRQRVEETLGALRQAVRERSGMRLERRTWALPLAAAAVGFSLAFWLRRRRRREDSDDY